MCGYPKRCGRTRSLTSLTITSLADPYLFLHWPLSLFLWIRRLWQPRNPAYTSHLLSMSMRGRPRGQTAVICASLKLSCPPTWNTFCPTGHINTHQFLSELLQYRPLSLSIHLLLSAVLSMPSVTTRQKNKTSHPGAPDMTPSQLASAGIACTKNSKKAPSKDQQIAALKEELRAAQEAISNVSRVFLYFLSHSNAHLFTEPFQ